MHWEVIRVFGYGLLTCVTTGLGAVPFLVVKPGPLGIGLAVANAVAAGMMLAASASMLVEERLQLQRLHPYRSYIDHK